jgi:hypothetical protein
MAENLHAVSVACFGSEPHFSVGRLVCPYQRNRLDRITITQLMMTRHHQKLMFAIESFDKKSVAAQKMKYKFTKDDYEAVGDLEISDDDMDNQQRASPRKCDIEQVFKAKGSPA